MPIVVTNLAPTGIDLSSNVTDEGPSGTLVGTLTTMDFEASGYTYALATGEGDDNNASFTLDGDQLKTAAILLPGSYHVRIRSTDPGDLWAEQPFTITINNLAPSDITLSPCAINEGSPSNTTVGVLTSNDYEPSGYNYTLVSGEGDADNGSFTISGNLLKTGATLPWGSYGVRVRSTDVVGASFEKSFVVVVNNQPPTNIALSCNILDEGTGGATVGTLTTSDYETSGYSYSLVSGEGSADNARFVIDDGQLKTFDTLPWGTYRIHLRSTDAGGMWCEKSFTITVNDLAPTSVDLSRTTVDEGPSGTVVGLLSTMDYDASGYVYTLASGEGDTDNACFGIDGDQVSTAATLLPGSYHIRVRSTDSGGRWFERPFAITVNGLLFTPESLSADEGRSSTFSISAVPRQLSSWNQQQFIISNGSGYWMINGRSDLPLSADASSQDLQAVADAIFGAGNSIATKLAARTYRLEYVGELAGQCVPELSLENLPPYFTMENCTTSPINTSTMYVAYREGGSRGTWTISGNESIPWNADAATWQAALDQTYGGPCCGKPSGIRRLDGPIHHGLVHVQSVQRRFGRDISFGEFSHRVARIPCT